MTHDTIYKSLIRIVPEILAPDFEYRKLQAPGCGSLYVELLPQDDDDCVCISLYYTAEQSVEECIPTPGIDLIVFPDSQRAEVTHYYTSDELVTIYPAPGRVHRKARKRIHRFLNSWLKKIIAQGHH